MAEIILKIGSSELWDDGDVVEAVNDRITSSTHIQILADPRKEGFNSSGLRPDSLGKAYSDCMYQYRFERVSKTEAIRIELDNTGAAIADSDELFGPESINVEEFVFRRYRNPKHRLFGVRGAEIWYGGQFSSDLDAIDNAWTKIESYTDKTRTQDEFKYFPLGTLDKKHFLAVPMEDFVDEALAEKKEPLWKTNESGLYLWTRTNDDLSTTEVYSQDQPEGNWEKVYEKNRVRNVDWRSQLDGLVDPSQVLDLETSVDIRLTAPNQSRDIQKTKYNNENISPIR